MASTVAGPVTPAPKSTRNPPFQNGSSPIKGNIANVPRGQTESGEVEDDDSADETDTNNTHVPPRGRASRSPTPLTTENLNLFNSTTVASQEAGTHNDDLGMFDLGMSQEDEDINADDDDYNAIDQISNSSDQSDAFEKAVEQEIMAEGENGIDWDDEATFQYNDSWEANQYSLAVDFGEPQSILEQELHQRRPEPLTHSEPPPANNLSTFLKGTPLDEDWSSSSSSSSSASQADDADDERRDSQASAASGESEGSQDNAVAGAAENASSSGDETDDEVQRRETVSTPAISLSRANSRRRIVRAPGVRSSIEVMTPDHGKKPGRFGVMRKFVINPNKAVAFSSPDPTSPGGRTIHFNAPKNRNVNWVSRHTSRSSSMSAPRTPMNEEHARTLTETINGRLFQRFNCTPEALAAMSGPSTQEYGSSSLFARRRLMDWNTSSASLPQSVLADLDGAELDDSAHEEFFDFQAGSVAADDDEPSQLETPMPPPPRPLDMSTVKNRSIEPATPTPASMRQALPSSPLARVSRPAKPELGAPFKEAPPVHKVEPKTPESDFAVPATASSSPRKRRGSEDVETATTLTPVMKRQRF